MIPRYLSSAKVNFTPHVLENVINNEERATVESRDRMVFTYHRAHGRFEFLSCRHVISMYFTKKGNYPQPQKKKCVAGVSSRPVRLL
uniref:Uncharacterized protein n=1 Tax=Megaselia scalaris TaxID=36166 RepID=T1GUF6_MEGSC